jgi:hypothetical protein
METSTGHHLGHRSAATVEAHVPEHWEMQGLGADEAHRGLLAR